MNIVLISLLTIMKISTGDPVSTTMIANEGLTQSGHTEPNINVNCCKYQRVPGDIRLFCAEINLIFRRRK